MKLNRTSLIMAEHQLTGFGHCSKGYDIKSLAIGMALTKEEWLELRKRTILKQSDIYELNKHFGIQ